MRRRTLFGSIIVGYGEWEINISANPSTIENTGGTVAISATASRLVYWSDKSVTTEEGIPTISVSAGNFSNGILTLGANTSTSVKTITITAIYEGTTQTLDISQAGKTIKSYSDWTVTVSANPTSGISAAGDTSIITRNASRIATWTDDSTTTETATPTLETNLGSISGNTLTLGANTSTSTRTATITASHGGKSATCTVTQNADTVSSYGNVNLTVGTIADVPASGGSVTSTGSSATLVLTWVSGRTTTVYPAVTEGSISGIDSKGTTISKRVSIGTVTISATGQGNKTASEDLTVYQAANLVTAVTANSNSFSYGNIGAGATSATPTTSHAPKYTFSSTATSTTTPSSTYGSLTTSCTYAIANTTTNGFTACNSSTGVLTATARGTTIGNARTSATVTKTLKYTWTPASGYGSAVNSGDLTKTATCTLNGNYVTSISVASASLSYTAIGAGATSSGSPTVNTGTVTYTFTSTSTTTTKPSSTYGSLSTSNAFSIANTTTNGFTGINSSTGVLTATSRGTSYGASARSSATVTCKITYTWTPTSSYNSAGTKTTSASPTATCSQNANLITKLTLQSASGGALTNPATYGAGENTKSVANKTAASCGCKVEFSSGGSSTSYSTWVTLTTTYSWSSNQSYATLTSSNAASLNVKMASRGTTAGSARSATITRTATFNASLKSGYTNASAVSTSASCTATVTQEANVKDASCSITAYGTPSVSIGSGITAAGGSATITRSVTNSQQCYYTSGSNGTASNPAGTVTLSIVSNGNNRFSLSGTTLSHSSMGTSETTDTCTVRAYNASSTGKYKDASVSITNSKTITSYTNATKSLTASKTSVSSSKNTVTLTSSFTAKPNYKYSSGNTSQGSAAAEGVTLSITSGSSYASLSGTTLTINANTGTSSRSVTVQAKGNNSGATATVTITQASNYCYISIYNNTDGIMSYYFGAGKSGTISEWNSAFVTVTKGLTGSVAFDQIDGPPYFQIFSDSSGNRFLQQYSVSILSDDTQGENLTINGDYAA